MTTEPPPEQDTAGNLAFIKYSPDLIGQLRDLSVRNPPWDVVLVDVSGVGFLFTAEILIEASRVAQSLLARSGVLVFVKADQACALVRQSLAGSFSFHLFDSLVEIYDLSPSLYYQVQKAIGQDHSLTLDKGDLSCQVLLSTTPVLTDAGIKLKASMDSSPKRNLTLQAIDSYTPLGTIIQQLTGRHHMTYQECLEELKELEKVRAIHPVFPKVPFLVNAVRNRADFKFTDYLLSSEIITRSQLDEILLAEKNTPTSRLGLGVLAVARGFINSRQLEVCLEDQAFYGQSLPPRTTIKKAVDEAPVQSLVGHLGLTDAAGLLQSLASSRESGVLAVDYQNAQFRALFESGRLTHARVGKIQGDAAVVEFASVWREGVYVFSKRPPPSDLLVAACQLIGPLDKLLLDSALAQDNLEQIWKKLPRGKDCLLESLPDVNNLWQSGGLTDLEEGRPLNPKEVKTMQTVWQALDGLTPVQATIRGLKVLSTLEAWKAIDRLWHHRLVKAPPEDLHTPLSKFQQMAHALGTIVGAERNLALLRLSLRESQGYSVDSRMFALGSAGEVGVDVAAAKSAGMLLSELIRRLQDWQVKYIDYAGQEVGADRLVSIVNQLHQ